MSRLLFGPETQGWAKVAGPARNIHILAIFNQHLTHGLYGSQLPRSADHARAQGFIARFDLPLKAPDALHLALVGDTTLLTADRQLAENATKLRIATELLTT